MDSYAMWALQALCATVMCVGAACYFALQGRKLRCLPSDTKGGNSACVLAVGTALPPHVLTREDSEHAWKNYTACANLSAPVSTWVGRRIVGSGIETRWTVCPKFCQQFAGQEPGLYGDAPKRNPAAGQRAKVWEEEAPKLAVEAAMAAVRKYKGSKADITHVLFHSCTGFKTPGIELDIIERLALPNVVRKFGVNFTGCAGGFVIMQTAKYICEAEPGSTVLCVCAELCTIHQSDEDHRSAQMGCVLFGDAAAAVVIGPGSPGDWKMTRGASVMLPKETKPSITWSATDFAYRMWLDKTMVSALGTGLRSKWKQSLQHALGTSDPTTVEWAVHPGGKAILEMICDPRIGVTGPSGCISSIDLRHSNEVLREVGNVSSGTIIFILERILKETSRDSIFMLGFGPGLAIEYMGLTKVKAANVAAEEGRTECDGPCMMGAAEAAAEDRRTEGFSELE
eukprot:NODE_9484_length_1421_cov_7.265842.p1 GENE.NODE_9484_length_1421_cov_7.265842~~NODE_9484_length_1421_cov_7.265842.p1  ORF type:complete len:455 (-),score=81.66 NODE_9484_length_1421_cov_7.265842:18-1382(-)